MDTNSGYVSFNTITDVGGGDVAWSDPNNVKVSDNAYSICSGFNVDGSPFDSSRLFGTSPINTGNISPDSIIKGITGRTEAQYHDGVSSGASYWTEVYLSYDATYYSANLATSTVGSLDSDLLQYWGAADSIHGFSLSSDPFIAFSKLGVRVKGYYAHLGSLYKSMSIDELAISVTHQPGNMMMAM